MDEIKRKGLTPTEENERAVREGLRKEHGMAAYAKLNTPKIDEMIKKGDVVVDGLYSWGEYKVLKEKYGGKITVLAIYASPKTRYRRLAKRELDGSDEEMKKRPATPKQAKARDAAEIENIQKAGPIAMADHTIINEGDITELKQNIDRFLKESDTR